MTYEIVRTIIASIFVAIAAGKLTGWLWDKWFEDRD